MDTTTREEGAERPDALGPPNTKPTPQGMVYLLAIGVFSLAMLYLGANLVFLLGSLVLGSSAVLWFLARGNLRRLRAQRTLPRRTRVGLPTPLTWRLSNDRRSAALGVEIDDRPAAGSRPVRVQIEFPCVQGGSATDVTTQIVFGRRGRVDLSASGAWVWSRFPLGLFRAASEAAGSGQILVRPAEGRIGSSLRQMLRGRLDVESRRRRTWRGEDAIYGVREYREGDDPRRVHWRSTARRGTLVVSEWRAEQGREAVIVLGRGPASGARGNPAFERAVSCAATLWRHLAAEGLRARLLFGSGPALTMGEGGRGLDAGLDALALVPSQGARRPRRALRTLREPTAPRSVIYVAAGKEAGLSKDLIAAAGRGGTTITLRADLRSIRRYIQGLA